MCKVYIQKFSSALLRVYLRVENYHRLLENHKKIILEIHNIIDTIIFTHLVTHVVVGLMAQPPTKCM